ncbi:MAG: hypothetical protein KIT17_06140 [Rubrivivax sp.]|nr:hypothetical protein [Rubrivivax sp.]
MPGDRPHPRTLQRVTLRLACGLLAAAAAACTTPPGLPPLLRDDAGCHAWTAQLDAAVAAAGVADVEAERIDGFPGLRVDRVGEALRAAANADEAALAAWLTRAAALDRAARHAEIGNLPDATFASGPAATREQAVARADECRRQVVRRVLARDAGAATPAGPELRDALFERATVPARYSAASRALGLYPLLRWPFFAGVQGWQDEQRAAMARWAAERPELQRFVPGVATAGASPRWPAPQDTLGLPQPGEAEAARLLAWHAPVFEVEVRGDFDRFGAPAWGPDGLPRVNTGAPVVYQRLAHTRWQGRWLLQLVYTVWFPERPARSSTDLLAGTLDGVIVRLTLDEHGRPLLMDTIHACGCYHLFFPSAALRARADAPQGEEWLFAPAPLPPLPQTHRLVVRLASATHYVTGLGALPRGAAGEAADSTAADGTYGLQVEDTLRSLAAPGGRRSLYGPDGLVAGSERGERFFFWPMGIASAGAMRQWGHHATAFVGRRHFDDVDLIEQRFEPAAD